MTNTRNYNPKTDFLFCFELEKLARKVETIRPDNVNRLWLNIISDKWIDTIFDSDVFRAELLVQYEGEEVKNDQFSRVFEFQQDCIAGVFKQAEPDFYVSDGDIQASLTSSNEDRVELGLFGAHAQRSGTYTLSDFYLPDDVSSLSADFYDKAVALTENAFENNEGRSDPTFPEGILLTNPGRLRALAEQRHRRLQ